jgi:hypothetical protein
MRVDNVLKCCVDAVETRCEDPKPNNMSLTAHVTMPCLIARTCSDLNISSGDRTGGVVRQSLTRCETPLLVQRLGSSMISSTLRTVVLIAHLPHW